MGKLFQSELSNTLLQYFASQKKNGKGSLTVPENNILPLLENRKASIQS